MHKEAYHMENLDINWQQYFESISKVCPWSLESYEQGRIDFLPYNHHGMLLRDHHWTQSTQRDFDAVVWVGAPDDPEILDEICEVYENSKNCVYFWSHPKHTKGGHNQAPIPIIIQQDRQNLIKARKSLKKNK